MPDFPGRLIVINGQSNLDNDLLLRAGFPDATQAIAAATQFLLKTKKLMSGQPIIVTGNQGSFGDVSVIVMTDARADPSQPFAFAVAASSAEKTITTRPAGSKKSRREKSASASRKGGSKAGASKKNAAARKRRATKSSAKK